MKLNDSPDFLALLQCTREGDLEKVSSLVENFAVELNCVDRYDYSPLILASLCGHIEIVRYLLQHGALLERDTFDGARCLYGALNDEIRNLLLKYDASTSIDLLQPFAAHLTALRRNNVPLTSYDVKLESGEVTIDAHKFLLVARSAYIRQLLTQDVHADKKAALDMSFARRYLETISKYIYLDVLESNLSPEDLEPLLAIAKKLGLTSLPEYFLTSDTITKGERQQLQCRAAQDDLEVFVRDEVIDRAWRIQRPRAEALQVARNEILKDNPSSADALLAVNDGDISVIYPVHRAMLIRSEYYATVFTSRFAESYQEIPLLSLETTSQVAELVLTFLYVDRVNIPRTLALDVLEIASFLLLNKERSLKSLAAIVVTNDDTALPEDTDVFTILRIAWRTETERLEQYCAKYIARNLDSFLVEDDFRELIQESADRITNRQATDTIELIDDVRFYLSQTHGIYLEMDPLEDQKPGQSLKEDQWVPLTTYELRYNEQLASLDELLESMSLEA